MSKRNDDAYRQRLAALRRELDAANAELYQLRAALRPRQSYVQRMKNASWTVVFTKDKKTEPKEEDPDDPFSVPVEDLYLTHVIAVSAQEAASAVQQEGGVAMIRKIQFDHWLNTPLAILDVGDDGFRFPSPQVIRSRRPQIIGSLGHL